MKKIIYSTALSGILAIGFLTLPMSAFACDAMGPGKHMGSITSVNAADKTFTIRDAQLQIPITFKASDEIIEAVSGAKGGNVQVNFEEDDGTLTALGIIL